MKAKVITCFICGIELYDKQTRSMYCDKHCYTKWVYSSLINNIRREYQNPIVAAADLGWLEMKRVVIWVET